MSRINSNIPAMRAGNRLQVNQQDLELRLERLATGLRINRGADDPAGLIISENLRSEIRSTRTAISNSIRANNVIATAEGAMNEVSALLLELQGLIVSSANEAGLTDSEVRANQLAIDSILASIDRIGRTTAFGGQKLLDGTRAYLLSSVPPAAIASIELFSARLTQGSTRNLTVRVTQSAQTAEAIVIGTTAGGVSRTSATTIELRGALGGELLSFASGTTLSDIRTAINNVSLLTGVTAVVSSPTVGVAASALVLNSTTFGSDAFVSITPLAGNFIQSNNNGIAIRDTGVDAGVLVDGQPASVQGLRADLRANGLDARLFLTESFGQTLSTAGFSIVGGGGVFQLAPEVHPGGQIFVGLEPISSTHLGNAVIGRLHSLRSGGSNALASQNFQDAQIIVNESIDQVAGYRGRLGSIQRNHLDPNINAQSVALENVTASESVIRDADMAVEVSALTRAQVLVQSTQSVLQVANGLPNLVLALLG